MKKFINKFKYLILGAIVTLSFGGTVYAANLQPSFNPSLLPVETSKYFLGSTSPNRSWKGLYVDQVCLTADTCRTTWPTGGGSGSTLWATSTADTTTINPAGALNVFIGGGLNPVPFATVEAKGTSTTATSRVFALWNSANTNLFTVQNNGVIGVNITALDATLSQGSIEATGQFYSTKTLGNGFVVNSSGANYGLISNQNTGVWSLGYGTAVNTLATPVLVWNSSGNVGIGTTSPSALLSLGNGSGAAGTTAALGINFGDPTANLYRSAAGTIKTDGALVTGGTISSGGVISAGGFGLTGAYIQTSGSFGGTLSPNSFSSTFVSSGSGQAVRPVSILTTYNQSSATSVQNTDLLINRTETSLGTTPGNQYLIDAQVGGTSKFVITNTGNVGIGTTTPKAGLHVVTGGIIRVFGSGNNHGYYTINDSTGLVANSFTRQTNGSGAGTALLSAYHDLAFAGSQTSGPDITAAQMTLSNGNLGIGTSTPGAKLDVSGTNSNGELSLSRSNNVSATSEMGRLTWKAPNASGTNISWAQLGVQVANATAASEQSSLLFLTQNSGALGEKMRITSAGNLGLGTSTPQTFFHVVASSPEFRLTDTANTANYATIQNVSTDALYIQNLGGDLKLGPAGPRALILRTNATERARIDSGGNFGIATVTPWRKFSVTGTMAVDGLTALAGGNAVCLQANKEVTDSTNNTCITSSKFLKDYVGEIDPEIAWYIIDRIEPIIFKYKGDKSKTGEHPGFFAEDVAAIDKEIHDKFNVNFRLAIYATQDMAPDPTTGHVFKEGDPYSMDYPLYTAILTKGLQNPRPSKTAPASNPIPLWYAVGLLFFIAGYQGWQLSKRK